MGATLLGALAALQFDRIIAVGERLMEPAGQATLIETTATAGAAGLLCWVVCALVTRAISRAALKPYKALADHLERLADGDVDSQFDLRGPDADVRRLARAVILFHHRAVASQRAEAGLQARYDRLCQDQAEERRLLMGMLMSQRLDPKGHAAGDRDPVDVAPVRPGIPEPLSAAPEAAGGPPQTGRYDGLYEDARQRRLLMDMLMTRRARPEGPAAGLRPPVGEALAGFDIPERPSATLAAADGSTPHAGRIVDLTGRLKSPARRGEERPVAQSAVPDLLSLDFAFIRR